MRPNISSLPVFGWVGIDSWAYGVFGNRRMARSWYSSGVRHWGRSGILGFWNIRRERGVGAKFILAAGRLMTWVALRPPVARGEIVSTVTKSRSSAPRGAEFLRIGCVLPYLPGGGTMEGRTPLGLILGLCGSHP